MIPITQTKVVVRNSEGKMVQRGNCLAAVVASILEVQITDVPNVEVLFTEEGTPDDFFWQDVLMRFLTAKGYEYRSAEEFRILHKKEPLTTEEQDSLITVWKMPYLVTGKSARGVMHICIYRDGKLIHDPHPSREGLLTEEYFEIIEKVLS